MTIDLGLLLTVVSVSFAVFLGIKGLSRNTTTDIKEEVGQTAVINQKLDTIGSDVSDIKRDINTVRSDVKDLSERVIIVEQSTKSAHQRIDSVCNLDSHFKYDDEELEQYRNRHKKWKEKQ